MSTVTVNVPAFDAILRLDQEARLHEVLAGFGHDPATRARGERNMVKARQECSAAISALSLADLEAFQAYRTT